MEEGGGREEGGGGGGSKPPYMCKWWEDMKGGGGHGADPTCLGMDALPQVSGRGRGRKEERVLGYLIVGCNSMGEGGGIIDGGKGEGGRKSSGLEESTVGMLFPLKSLTPSITPHCYL